MKLQMNHKYFTMLLYDCINVVNANNITLPSTFPITLTNRVHAVIAAMHTSTPFLAMCRIGDLQLAQWYLSKYPETDRSLVRQAVVIACRYGHIGIASWIWSFDDMHTEERLVCSGDAFSAACRSGQIETVKWLWSIESVRADYIRLVHGWYLEWNIINVCKIGSIEMVELLLDIRDFIHEHADPPIDIVRFDIYMQDAFRIACERGHIKLAKWLMERRLIPDEKSEMKYILKRAMLNGHTEMVVWLSTIRPFAPDGHTWRMFVHACSFGHLEIAKLLMGLEGVRAAVITVKRLDLAFELACAHGHIETAKWLQAIRAECPCVPDKTHDAMYIRMLERS
jgi:ankyrin repeat protein